MNSAFIEKSNLRDFVRKWIDESHMPDWAIADSGLIQDLFHGRNVRYGPNGRRLRLVVSLFAWCRAGAKLFLYLIGLMACLSYLRQIKKANLAEVPNDELNLFVGFGAGPEEVLWDEFSTIYLNSAFRVNQTDYTSLGKLAKPSLNKIIILLWFISDEVASGLWKSSGIFVERRYDLITSIAMRMGCYAFFRAWFAAVAVRKNVKKVNFLSADMAAFACVDNKCIKNVEYRQHGLIRWSLVFPRFTHIVALTADEGHYFAEMLPEATIELEHFPIISPDFNLPVVLIASVYVSDEEKMKILDLINWAKDSGLKVIVRPHPREGKDFWMRTFPEIEIDHSKNSFIQVLQTIRPIIVVSWFSTALADALQCGILPVMLTDPESDVICDLVYPIVRRSAVWPAKEKLVQALESRANYQQLLHQLQVKV